jgi:hypothetical protein
MSPESPAPADFESSLPGEALQSPLQEAVERIVERRVPEDALQRSLKRAQQPNPQPTSPVARVGWHKAITWRLAVAVVIGGWMVAAIVPAVREARETARKSTAKNNMRQIGMAVHNYHGTLDYTYPDINNVYVNEDGEGRFRRRGLGKKMGVPVAESSMPQRAFILGATLRKRRFDPSHTFAILKY